MPTRSLDVDGVRWNVFPAGYPTQYDADEFALIFVRGTGAGRDVRVTRYSPRRTRAREQSLAELGDGELRALFARSQPGETAPEAGYAR